MNLNHINLAKIQVRIVSAKIESLLSRSHLIHYSSNLSIRLIHITSTYEPESYSFERHTNTKNVLFSHRNYRSHKIFKFPIHGVFLSVYVHFNIKYSHLHSCFLVCYIFLHVQLCSLVFLQKGFVPQNDILSCSSEIHIKPMQSCHTFLPTARTFSCCSNILMIFFVMFK